MGEDELCLLIDLPQTDRAVGAAREQMVLAQRVEGADGLLVAVERLDVATLLDVPHAHRPVIAARV
jgi:hypothetical protein